MSSLFAIIWDFVRNLWSWFRARRAQQEREVRDRAAELARGQQEARGRLQEQEELIDRYVQARQAVTDPDAVVAELNDFFGGVRSRQSGDQTE